jgi:deoxyribonuclease-4
MLLGLQVSTEGGISDSIERAERLDCNAMQIFSRNPQRWRSDYIELKDSDEFRKRRKESGIKLLFIHVPYLINLASPNPSLYEASIEAYIEDVLEAHTLTADYIVTHMGSHKNTSEEAGIKRLIDALDIILDKTQSTDVGILLENTAGSGSWLGYKFSHQKKIMQSLKHRERVGLCLDTAHAYLAGYDISTKEGLDSVLDEIDNVGKGLLKMIHLNDAKDNLGSRRDRHEHIGKGKIGMEGMERIINHSRLRDLPFILETPKKTDKDDAMNLDTVRKLRHAG